MSRDFILIFSGGMVSLVTTLVVLFVADYFYRQARKTEPKPNAQTQAAPTVQPKTVEPKPQPVVADQSPQKKIVESKPQPVIADQAPQKTIVESKPPPVVADQAPQKTIVESKPQPVVADQAPQKKIVEPKPQPALDDQTPPQKCVEPQIEKSDRAQKAQPVGDTTAQPHSLPPPETIAKPANDSRGEKLDTKEHDP